MICSRISEVQMVKQVKLHIAKEIEDFMENNLVNHRKRKEGLVSLQNMLVGDIKRFLNDWKQTEQSYLDFKLKGRIKK